MTLENYHSLFPKGEKGSADYFTGTAWVNNLVRQDETGSYSVSYVVFEAGSRNHWHTHPAGQILLITTGEGFYQERSRSAQLLTPGEVVIIPSNTEHWHGASRDSSLTHIVITNNTEQGAVKWLGPVTEEEYDSVQSPVSGSDHLNLSETAIGNYAAVFGHSGSRLKKSDPELIEIFDNFAFDEVIGYGNLDTHTRVMMILASTIASQALHEFKVMLRGALHVGITPVEIKEIVYQAVPYVGISKVLDFLYLVDEILESKGISLPLESQSETSRETRFEKGLSVQKEIFGEMVERMHKESPKSQQHIQYYLSANCFGDYYTRKGLDLKTRELLTFSMLIALGGAEPQLKAHVMGNVNVGNDKQTLLNVITQLLPYVGYPRTLTALNCLNEVLPE